MKWAQRWSVNEDGEMVMDDHGSWVENAYYEYLKADYAVLKDDAQLVVKHLGEACAENARLKAEVERLNAMANECEHLHKGIYSLSLNVLQLKAEVERLRKAGDAVALDYAERIEIEAGETAKTLMKTVPVLREWNAAKEGKPSV
jgi:hypothetical protein